MTESRHQSSLEHATLHWRDDGLPVSGDYGDIYFSSADPAGETEHVFLHGNDLPRRWRELAQERFTLAELGFGSGLNFLCAWRLWERLAPPGRTLHYIAVERHPLAPEDLARLHALWPDLDAFGAALRRDYQPEGTGVHRLRLGSPARPVLLDLHLGGAAERLEDLAALTGPCVQAWFLDGFAPADNPAMWSRRLMRAAARLSVTGASASTYSVARAVRDNLEAAGFATTKVPGFGRKRHMLRAELRQPQPPEPLSGMEATPWFALPRARPRPRRAAVIGAGLAGCSTARALAERGIEVILLEQHDAVAAGASGNPQGILYLPLSPSAGPRARYLLQSYLHAVRRYRHLREDTGDAIGWHQCGLLQLALSRRAQAKLDQSAQNTLYSRRILRLLDAGEAGTLAGVELDHAATFLPLSGWLNPAALCQQYRGHANIHFMPGARVETLERGGEGWELRGCTAADGSSRRLLCEAEAVVVAGSREAAALAQCAHYPLRPVRGQVSYVPATPASAALRTIICTNGYIIPAAGATHSLGGSYTSACADAALRVEDHHRNLGFLEAMNPALARELIEAGPAGGRAAIRSTTPDHLAVAGPVEQYAATLQRYGALSRSANARFDAPGIYEPGLYINAGHGSHGITTTPLLAEYLAALVCGEPPPLEAQSARLLHPARFLIRQLKKQEIPVHDLRKHRT